MNNTLGPSGYSKPPNLGNRVYMPIANAAFLNPYLFTAYTSLFLYQTAFSVSNTYFTLACFVVIVEKMNYSIKNILLFLISVLTKCNLFY